MIFRKLLVNGVQSHPSNLTANSKFNHPITQTGIVGQSRSWGHIEKDKQNVICMLLCSYLKAFSFTNEQIAFALCLVRTESGFNPSAAASTTSASGLGQFVKATGQALCYQAGMKQDADLFDINTQLAILPLQLRDCFAFAKKKVGLKSFDFNLWSYKYHHDGPTGEYGGIRIAQENIVPFYKDAWSLVNLFFA